MAELMATIMAAGTAATATTAGSLATAATAAGSTAAVGAGLSSTLGTLGTVATVASMSAALLGGVMGYRQAQDQAKVADLNAESARLSSEEQALRIRKEMVQKVGAARVAFAGSGLDISSSDNITAGYGREAGFEIGLARAGGDIQAAGQSMQAAQYRTRGYAALADAAAKATGAFVDNKISIARRG